MVLFRSLIAVVVSLLISGLASATVQPLGAGGQLMLPTTQGGSPADRYYAEAIALVADNQLDRAELAFKRALEKQPTHANSLLGLAEIAFRKKHPEEAEKLINQAVKAEPNNAHAQSSLGRLLAVQKRYKDAEVALNKAIDLDKTLVRPRMDLADIYATALRKPSEALALYQNVLEIEPDHAGANYAKGLMQLRLGDTSKGRAALEASARLEPVNPLPPIALGQLDLQLKELDSAMRWVERALSIQPGLASALELRADVQRELRLTDKALTDYAAAIRAQPNQVSALLKQGALLQQLGRSGDAEKSYRAALKVNSRLPDAYNNLAWMAAESGKNLDQAEAWGKKAIELSPETADFHDTLGWIYRAQGRLKDAEQVLKHASALKQVSPSLYFHLGVVLQESGKPHEAADAFRKALALDSNYQAAEQALRRLDDR